MANSFLCNPSFHHNTVGKHLQWKHFSTASPNARAEFGITPPRDSICKQTPHCPLVVTVWVWWVLSLKSTTSFVQTTGRRRSVIKIAGRPPALEVTPSSSRYRPPAAAPWLSSARPNGAAHPCLGFGNTNSMQILPGTPFYRALGQGRLVVGTEQPLSPLRQGQPSTSVFLVFPKPQESRKSQSLTNLSLS